MRVEDLLTGHWEVVRVRERREFIEYYLDHAHDQFYVFTNSVPSREYQVCQELEVLLSQLFVGNDCLK